MRFCSSILDADMIPSKITFRLRPNEAKEIYYQARELKVSPHQLARDMVIERLTLSAMEEHLQQMAQEVEDIRSLHSDLEKELQGITSGLIDTLSVVIANQLENISENESKEWVEERFNNPRENS